MRPNLLNDEMNVRHLVILCAVSSHVRCTSRVAVACRAIHCNLVEVFNEHSSAKTPLRRRSDRSVLFRDGDLMWCVCVMRCRPVLSTAVTVFALGPWHRGVFMYLQCHTV